MASQNDRDAASSTRAGGWDFHSYEPRSGHGLRHDPMRAIVGPRPIGWISTVSPDGVENLAPFSFFNLFCGAPPLLGFASGAGKDSLHNARETGRFVWNLSTRPLAQAMNITSSTVPPDVDEFALAGLTCAPSTFGAPGYVRESPVSFDCVVTQIVDLVDRNGTPSGTTLVMGEAVYVRIARHLVIDGVYNTPAADPVLRGGGRGDYFTLTPEGHFFMPRPD